jgi:DNA repair protein RadC
MIQSAATDKIQGGIKGWPVMERPRERLIQNGSESLSDAELVAILLRSGIPGKDSVQLARDLIGRFGSLRGLFSAGHGELRKIKGVGMARIAVLLAATEIAKRRLREDVIGRHMIRDPEAVMQYLTASLCDKKKEVFKVLFLNKGNRVIDECNLFEGTVDETAVHPREIVKAAIDRYATAVVLVHNHPSGRIDPSTEDRHITRKIQDACSSVSVKVLDHIIVGDKHYFSFREQGLLL